MPTSNRPTSRPTTNSPTSNAASRRPASNAEIAAAFHELAELLQIDGGDRFRIQAYRRAADAISIAGRPLAMMSDAELPAVRGIGAGTAAKVKEYLSSG